MGTERDRKTMQAMASYGVPQDEIAFVIGVEPKTLRKHYYRELAIAAIVANLTVAQNLFQIATMPDHTAAKVAAANSGSNAAPAGSAPSAEPSDRDIFPEAFRHSGFDYSGGGTPRQTPPEVLGE